MSSQRALAAVVILVLAGILAFSGCGDESGDAGEAEATTTERATESDDSTAEGEEIEVQQEIAAVFLSFADGLEEFLSDVSGCTDFDCLTAGAVQLRGFADDTGDELSEIDVDGRGNACQQDVVADLQRGLGGMEDAADAIEEGDADAVGSVLVSSRADLESAIEDLNDCL